MIKNSIKALLFAMTLGGSVNASMEIDHKTPPKIKLIAQIFEALDGNPQGERILGELSPYLSMEDLSDAIFYQGTNKENLPPLPPARLNISDIFNLLEITP